MRQGVRKVGGASLFGGIIQEVEVRAGLEAETDEQCIDQIVDHQSFRLYSSRPVLGSCLLKDAS